MMNKYINLGMGIVMTTLPLYFIHTWLYTDICLDLGNIISDGLCLDENHQEIPIIIGDFLPLVGVALLFSVGCVAIINWVYAKII